MCSILGGTKFDETALEIYNKAKDRGRDFTGLVEMNGNWIANHRATPTNEHTTLINNQPLGRKFKIVHNGTISNDKELGVKENEVDSQAFINVLNIENVNTIADSLNKIKGSYALAIITETDIFLACNYKPIFYVCRNGEYYFSSLKWHIGEDALRVKPYSVLNLKTGETSEIKRYQSNRALIVCSGGLDSTSLLGYAKKNHDEIKIIHFNYGCRAGDREIEAIKKISKKIDCEYEVLDIDYTKFKGNSTLFQDKKIKTGKSGVEYALDWVYARNLIMLSIATAYAESNDFGYIYIGTNLEEAGAYPDNEEQFILDFNSLLYGAVNNGFKLEIVTPLGGLMKKEIVEFGEKHNSPIDLSWSCYNNEEFHCGECSPCYMRKKAFERAGIKDKTIYMK